MDSLLNNNDKNFFFLKASIEDDLYEDSCAFLHLAITIKAEHYEKCLQSKRLELTDNFKSKLGWMVGNLYSRVGTEDYVPAALPDQEAFDRLIDDILKNYILWVPLTEFQMVKKEIQHCASVEEAIEKVISNRESNYEQRIKGFVGLLKGRADLNGEQVKIIKKFLLSQVGRRYITRPS